MAKHMKKCWTSLAIKSNANHSHIKVYLIPIGMTTIKNTNNNKCWQG
jgi:hypothetical protein